MRVLGINYAEDRSSAVSVHNNSVVGGLLASGTAFPASEIQHLTDPHSSLDYLATTSNRDLKELKALLKPLTQAELVAFDYREALAMSSICMRDWKSCAVMVVDSYYCSLGYYVGGQFHWLREFSYPNSLSLFYSAAARLLGFDPLSNEYQLVEASEQGSAIYSGVIQDRFIHIGDGDYTLLHNLERGVGSGSLNLDIAASVQDCFTKTVLSLALWLSKQLGEKKLAYAGRASANYLTNTRLAESKLFDELSIQPLTSAAGAALGSASLLSRPIYDRIDIGYEQNNNLSCEQLAAKLIRGEVVQYVNGRTEFVDRSTLNNNWLAIPFKTVIPEFRAKASLFNSWQQPFVVCQEKDYSTYFSTSFIPTYGQFSSASAVASLPQSRVVTTTLNRNSYINRVLEILRAQGYPVLISAPIERL